MKMNVDMGDPFEFAEDGAMEQSIECSKEGNGYVSNRLQRKSVSCTSQLTNTQGEFTVPPAPERSDSSIVPTTGRKDQVTPLQELSNPEQLAHLSKLHSATGKNGQDSVFPLHNPSESPSKNITHRSDNKTIFTEVPTPISKREGHSQNNLDFIHCLVELPDTCRKSSELNQKAPQIILQESKAAGSIPQKNRVTQTESNNLESIQSSRTHTHNTVEGRSCETTATKIVPEPSVILKSTPSDDIIPTLVKQTNFKENNPLVAQKYSTLQVSEQKEKTLDRKDDLQKTFKCVHCSRQFKRSCHLARHNCASRTLEIRTPVKDLECDLCGRKFGRSCHVAKHRRSCEKQVNIDAVLSDIQDNDDNTDKRTEFTCDICQRRFSRRCHLVNHHRTHKREEDLSAHKIEESTNINTALSDMQDNDDNTDKTEKTEFTCDICQRRFSRRCHLVNHHRTHKRQEDLAGHKMEESTNINAALSDMQDNDDNTDKTEKTEFTCDICQRRFSRRCHLVNHHRIHKREEDLAGHKMEESTNINAALSDMQDNDDNTDKTEKTEFTCDICQRRFSRRCHLVNHHRTHKREEDLSAHKIEESTNINAALSDMQDNDDNTDKTEKTEFTCDICQRRFSRRCHLVNHHRTHKREEDLSAHKIEESTNINAALSDMQDNDDNTDKKTEFTCDICQRRFSRRCHLVNHHRTHKRQEDLAGHKMEESTNINAALSDMQDNDDNTDKKTEFTCDICQRRFSRRCHLVNHHRTHKREEDLSAHKIEESTNINAALSDMQDNDDNTDKKTEFTCDICQRRFSRRCHLVNHHRTHKRQEDLAGHKMEESTNINAALSDMQDNDDNTDKKTEFTCDICQRRFSRRCHLVNHHRTHKREEDLLAHKIEESTNINAALSDMQDNDDNTDKTEKTEFTCDICQRRFSRRCHLVNHHRTHKREEDLLAHKIEESTNINAALSDMQDNDDNTDKTEKTEFTCDICQRRFSRRCHLVNHHRTHKRQEVLSSNNEELQCKLLETKWDHRHRKFGRPSHLVKNRVANSLTILAKDYYCHLCQRKFSRPSHLGNHLRSHKKRRSHRLVRFGKRYKLVLQK